MLSSGSCIEFASSHFSRATSAPPVFKDLINKTSAWTGLLKERPTLPTSLRSKPWPQEKTRETFQRLQLVYRTSVEAVKGYLGWRNKVEVAEASHIDRMEEVEADRAP